MATSWAFLLVVFAALCGMAIVIVVLVMMFRAATRANGRGPEQGGSSDTTNTAVPPVLGDNSLTNPALPLHSLHHSSPISDEATRHHSAAASMPSFDSGTAPSPAPDCGSPSPSPDGGSGCG